MAATAHAGDVPVYTLADLRSPQSQAVIRAALIAELQAAGVPTADWIPSEAGGVENIRADAVSGAMAYWLSGRVAELARDGLLELATGDGLKFYARQRYRVEKDLATKTVQNVALWLVGGTAKTFKPGDLIVRSRFTGNRYTLIDDMEVAPENTETNWKNASFEAEVAGSSYADVAGTILDLVTAPSGLRCINKRPSDFLASRTTGFSTGFVSGFFLDANTPPSFGSVRIRVKTQGDLGTATFDYSIDGGRTWTFAGVVQDSYNIGGAVLLFSNGTSPSFIAGDIITLLVADAILVRGADEETDEALRARCRGKWTTLTKNVLASTVDLWAHVASRETDRVLVDANPSVPGGILVTVASATGPASPSAIADIQDYIQLRLRGYQGMAAAPTAGFLSPEETVLCESATAKEITAGGTVDVPRSKIVEVKTAADTAWLAYLKSLPLGVHPDGVVRISELVQAVMDAGARDIQNPLLNTGSSNITLAQNEVAVAAADTSLFTSLVWRAV